VIRYKKKIVVFLITVALGSGVLLLCSGQSHTDETKLVLAEGETEENNSKTKTDSLFENDSDFSMSKKDRPSTRELFFKMIVSVLLLVALGAGAIYVSKRLGAKITNLPGKKIRIAETVHLGPRKAVHLLEIGNRRLLIASTNENITRLADLTAFDAGSWHGLPGRESITGKMPVPLRESRNEDINEG